MRHRLGLGFGMLCLVACGSSDGSSAGNSSPPVAPIAQAKSSLVRNTSPTVAASDQATLATDNKAFALSAYTALAKGTPTSNVFFSPYSISSALAMTYAGANGQTATEIATALHFTLPQAQLHPAFDRIDLALTTLGPTGPVGTDDPPPTPFTLHVANSLWGAKDETFKQPFLDTLATNYGTGVYLDDFALPSSEKPINQWVSDQTNAKITDLIPPNKLDASTRFVLVNAIYFDADWAAKFDPGSTSPQTFTTPSGAVSTPMMHGNDEFSAAATHTAAYDAIELPYNGGTAVMDIVMPAAGTFDTFEPTLTADSLSTIVKGLTPSTWVQLSLPKFAYQGDSIDLVSLLQGLGMNTAFSAAADFSNMVPDSVFIGDVLQKAFLRVDENGTEAAAATAVIGEATSGRTGTPTVITIDHPFFFTIRDTATDTILFAGRILDPSK